ncbi:MAG: PAS domain S-box protein [Proteobacteria bacterium]|nr:PAS domain S-box protein [Pseudomonadota bacterium]MBU1737966.1 PAS domain S-box protein [Pseudomonadota bacterium]
MPIVPRRLSSRLILLVSFILLSTGITSGWMMAGKQAKMLADSMRRNAALMAENLAERCAYHMVLNDYAGLEGILVQATDKADIKRLRVSEPNGFVLGDVMNGPDGKPQRGSPGVINPPPPSFTPDSMIEGNELVVRQPISAGAPLGWLEVTFDLSSIQSIEMEARKYTILFSLLWVGLSACLLLIMLRPLVRSIGELTDFARRLDQRKGERISISQQQTEEITELAVSLNDVSLKLLSSERQMLEDRELLLRSEKKYRSLIAMVGTAIVVHDGNGLILESNPRAQELLGLSADQLLGREVIDPDWCFLREDGAILPVDEYPVSKVLASRQPLRDYVIGLSTPGHDHISWVLANAEPEYNDNGDVRQVIVSFMDITERMFAEQVRLNNLRLFETLDLVNRAIQGSESLEQMMSDVLDEVLSVFDCDRAFLMFPCDPEAKTWSVPMERNKPDYPGVLNRGIEIPMDPEVAGTLRILLNADGPVKFGPGTPHKLPADVSEQFGFKCFMSLAVHPKIGKPWQFGIHQCSHAREWTAEEEQLFLEIGRRLTDGLTSMLINRNLKESEARFSTLVNQAADGFFLHDLEGQILEINQTACKSLGYTREELLQMNVAEVDAEFISHDHVRNFWSKLSVNHPVTLEGVHKRKDGTTFPVEVRLGLLQFEDRRVILGLARDITERKSAEVQMLRSAQRLHLHMEQSPLGYLEWDENFRAVEWNAACEQIFGYSREEAIGHHARDLILPEAAHDLEDGIFRNLINREDGRHSINENVTRDGRTIICEWFNTTLVDKDDKAIGVASICNDITEQKRMEIELAGYREHLEEQVKERTTELETKSLQLQDSRHALINLVEDLNQKTEELEAANAKLQELDRLKSMFIASMSHELRTPLNSIIGFSTIVLDEWFGPLNTEQKEKLATVLRAGRHLLVLINDVIDISKIEAGTIDPLVEDFELEALVKEAVEYVKTDIENKKLHLEIKMKNCRLHTDRRRLFQCLLNLLSNAVKFTEDGEIQVNAGLVVPEDRNRVRIEVRDTGIGIAPEDQARLFTPFFRIESPLGPQAKGTGLGLYLVRKICHDILHGDVGVKSEPGKGSLFFLTVPLSGETKGETDEKGTGD